jgi:hypothetical protein
LAGGILDDTRQLAAPVSDAKQASIGGHPCRAVLVHRDIPGWQRQAIER